jgi:hypothetical protein
MANTVLPAYEAAIFLNSSQTSLGPVHTRKIRPKIVFFKGDNIRKTPKAVP